MVTNRRRYPFIGPIGNNIIDFILLLCLGVFGIFILLTVQPSLVQQQIFFLLIAGAILLFVSAVDATVYYWLAPFAYLGSIIILLLAYLGPVIRGARRWIVVGGVQLQTSEMAKPFLLLTYAWLMTKLPPKSIRNILIHTFLFIIPFGLVFRQPDLGTSLLYAGSWVAMMIASGFSVRSFVFLVCVFSLLLPWSWHSLHDYQQKRIETFIDPSVDPRGAGYNAIQSTIAVGSGQIIGRGLGRGTQSHLRFLPEFHTDFIFATLVEELGLLGGLLLFGLYGALLFRIILPLLNGKIEHILPFVYSIGLFTMLLLQIFINTGMNMGIIPVTGITLPFVSYGGSSVFAIAVSYAILWSLKAGENRSIAEQKLSLIQ